MSSIYLFQSLLKEMDEKAEFDRKMREKEKEIWKIKVYVLHPTLNRMIDARVDCNTNTPLKEVTQIAFKVSTLIINIIIIIT